VRTVIAKPGEAVDRQVEPLEVVSAVERGHERGDHRFSGYPKPLPESARVLAGGEQLGVDAVGHLDQLRRVVLSRAAQVRDRVRVIGGQHADPVGRADQRGANRVLIGLEQGASRTVLDEAVLVVDEQRLGAALAREPGEQGELRAEDERVVQVDDVEPFDAAQARDQRRVADREHGLDPVHDHPARVGSRPWRGGGEDLDVISAPGLLARETEGRVAGAASVGREGGCEVGDAQAALPGA
jgi:hypothetical protein